MKELCLKRVESLNLQVKNLGHGESANSKCEKEIEIEVLVEGTAAASLHRHRRVSEAARCCAIC